jgi:hypothetical protein
MSDERCSGNIYVTRIQATTEVRRLVQAQRVRLVGGRASLNNPKTEVEQALK